MRISRFALGMTLAVGCAWSAAAQEVPKVMLIQREYLKPGKAGGAHEKTEGLFVEAMRKAKWPTNYIGLTSLSGKSRAIFLTSYPSFEAYQKDGDAVGKNAVLSASLDKAYATDGDLLDSADQGLFYFHEEMSMNTKTDLSGMRYLEVMLFHVKPGKDHEFAETVKMAKAGYEKGVPAAHWGMFEQVYGGDSGTYILLVSHKTLDEIDKGFAEGKKFEAAMGEEGMKKFGELSASCLVSIQQQLFSVNPHMSYVKDEWIKADPDFWRPKAAVMAAKATEEKKP